MNPLGGLWRRIRDRFPPRPRGSCVVCGRPLLPETTPRDGGTVCTICLRLPTRCSFCENDAVGEIKVFDSGQVLCSACDDRLPACVRCGRPAGPGGEDDPPDVCVECRPHVARCGACGEWALGKWVLHPNRPERRFHPRCFDGAEKCDACGGPVGPGARRLTDGRTICAECRGSAVRSPEELARLASRIERLIAGKIGLKYRHRVAFHFSDANEIASLQGTVFTATPEFDERTLGIFRREGEDFRIYVEGHLPRVMTTAVLTHEMAHAWQAENCPQDQSPMVKEGFAEWVAYCAVKELGERRYLERMKERTDIYGRGLHRMLELESRLGARGLLRRVTRVV